MNENAAGGYISAAGGRPFQNPAFFLDVSPSWMNTMRIPFLAGTDFRAGGPSRNIAIINQAFANQFLKGRNALNSTFVTMRGERGPTRFTVVGVVRNARYATVRGPMPPVAYFPLEARNSGAFIVRMSSANPLALANHAPPANIARES